MSRCVREQIKSQLFLFALLIFKFLACRAGPGKDVTVGVVFGDGRTFTDRAFGLFEFRLDAFDFAVWPHHESFSRIPQV